MKLMDILAVLSFTILYAACTQETHRQSTTSPDIGKATRIDVTFFNLATGNRSDLLKSITAPEEIASVIMFVNTHLLSKPDVTSGWCHISRVQDRSTILNLGFYEGNEYKGTCGIGPDGSGGFFLKYHYYGQSKVTCISNKERKEFLALTGVSEEKYQDLFKGL